MTILEEVKKMKEQGMPENEIIQTLQESGLKYKEISEALAQSNIRAAVEEPSSETPLQENPPETLPETNIETETAIPNQNIPEQSKNEIPGMQKSVLETSSQENPGQISQPTPTNNVIQGETVPETEYVPQTPIEGQYEYPAYEQSSQGVSSDIIAEISEQVVSEKLSEIREHLEKVIDFKMTIESKTESIDERLKRLEKIIDTLQSSVLRKVGDYVTNVDDIKKELIETQKTFSRLVPEINKKNIKKNSEE
tara:strand:- start:359 stop:1114 length:756 start_codon:yes stop_codon:yes gene_type:complete